MIYVLILFFIIYFIYLLALLYFSIRRNKDVNSELREIPNVSVLVAARNEELTILSCLEALARLDYPKEKIEILIGDDNSEDKTFEIVSQFVMSNPEFQLISIKDNLGTAKGKANVLAHLAHKASSDFFFITDADIEVPASWIKGLLKHYEKGDGIISGVSIVDGKGIMAKMQSFEWIYAFGMVKVVSDFRIPVSAVGNNMLISRVAYEATGGYECIPFSVTEDFELFRQTLKKGYGFKNLMNHDVLAFSKPITTIKHLFHQRKRWMSGALDLPIILQVCLFAQSLFLPFIILALSIGAKWGLLLWVMKMVLQNIFISIELKRLQWRTDLLKNMLIFEIYSGILSVALLIYYVMPTGITWKGRTY